MLELLQTIALLCTINGSHPQTNETYQINCQKYFIKCERNMALDDCILERKVAWKH